MLSAAIALALAAPAIPLARGQGTSDGPAKASIGELKSAYLSCNRAALADRQDSGSIMQCSVIYEALLQRGFGGDFTKLLAWSKAYTPRRLAAGLNGARSPAPDSRP
ncbi:MAG: hypothetical protein WCA01_11040 [Burkholderiales bacterium]